MWIFMKHRQAQAGSVSRIRSILPGSSEMTNTPSLLILFLSFCASQVRYKTKHLGIQYNTFAWKHVNCTTVPCFFYYVCVCCGLGTIISFKTHQFFNNRKKYVFVVTTLESQSHLFFTMVLHLFGNYDVTSLTSWIESMLYFTLILHDFREGAFHNYNVGIAFTLFFTMGFNDFQADRWGR